MENIGFTGINYEWFIGQVPPNQTLDKTSVDGWGDRVKVRIIGRHNKSGSITPDEKLPWAIVERPTTQGNASRGSTGLTGGEWVRGYYLDPFKQVPVIVSVLARGTYENNVPLTIVKERKSTEFENVTRYNAFGPHAGQRLGADKPEQSASISSDSKPTKQEFEKAKEIPQDQKDIQNNKEKTSSSTTTSTGIPNEPLIRQASDGKWEVTTYQFVDGERQGFTRVTNEPPSQSLIDAARFQQSQYYQNETNRLSVT